MLLVIFRSGDSRFAIDSRHVVEVVPRVDCRAIPHAPDYLAGLLSYRGRAVPVLDFGLLTGKSASREALSTRAIITESAGRNGAKRWIGIIAENVSRVVNVNSDQVEPPPVDVPEAPYLGGLIRLEDGLVQLVEVDKVLPERLDGLDGHGTEPR